MRRDHHQLACIAAHHTKSFISPCKYSRTEIQESHFLSSSQG